MTSSMLLIVPGSTVHWLMKKSCQVKWDFGQLKMTGYNPIIVFLYQRIQDRKLRALTALNGRELSPEELIDLAYWRKKYPCLYG